MTEHQTFQRTKEQEIAEALEGVKQSPTCSHYRVNGSMGYERDPNGKRIGNIPPIREAGWSCSVCTELEAERQRIMGRFEDPVKDAIKTLEGLGYRKLATELKDSLYGTTN